MKIIFSNKGDEILVDDEDFDFLSKHKWHIVSGYAVRWSNGKPKYISMHRFLLNLAHGDKRLGDHIDHNKLNNQRNNLRIVDHKKNGANRSSKIGSSSKYLGVSWYKRDSKWICHIKKDGKNKHLGIFDKEEDAARAYDLMAEALHGQYANLNFK